MASQYPFRNPEQARAHLAAIVESSEDAIISKTAEGVVLTWNAGAERLYGYSAAEAQGQPMTFLLPPERAGEEREILDRINRGERVQHHETVRLRKDGRPIHVSLTVSPIRDQNGQLLAIAHSARDISERKRSEELLRESAGKLQAFLESASQGVLATDPRGRIELVNAKVEEMFGYRRQELLGQSLENLLPERHRDSHVAHRAEYFDRPRPRPMGLGMDLAGRRKDGTEFPVEIALSFVDTQDGPLGLAFINDITERKHNEERLRQTQKLESLGLLAGGVAHDFNNLLTTIMGNATLALEAMRPTSPDRFLIEEIVHASKTAADLTRQLLAYAGKGRFVVQPIDLSQLVRDISTLVQTSIPKKVQLRLNLADDLPSVNADASQLQQLLMNLVINAGEAIGEHLGNILVSTQRQEVDDRYIEAYFLPGELQPGTYVALELNDTGAGMDAATVSRIFDPFFTTKTAGRGLGLSAVQGIVHAHKGAMRVYSAPGKGTTFKVLLPATSLPVAPREGAEEALQLPGSGRILVVDDEAGVRNLLKATIERQGYSAVTASDGAEAIAIIEREGEQIEILAARVPDLDDELERAFAHTPHLVLASLLLDGKSWEYPLERFRRLVFLDLTMPIMGGEETLRELRRRRPDLPVLLSSGFNESEALQQFAGKGLTAFVQKPFTARQVTDKIAQALQGRRK